MSIEGVDESKNVEKTISESHSDEVIGREMSEEDKRAYGITDADIAEWSNEGFDKKFDETHGFKTQESTESASTDNVENKYGKFESLVEPSTEVTDEVYREAHVANEMYDDLRGNGKSYAEVMDAISSGKSLDKIELDRGTVLARVEDGEHRFNEKSIYFTTDVELKRQGAVDEKGNVNEDVAKERFALPEYARNEDDGSVIGARSADIVSHREVEMPIKAYVSEVAPVRDSNGTDSVEHKGGARQIIVPDLGSLSDYKERQAKLDQESAD